MSISLQRLRYFHAIASRGSLSAASRELNIAQPALSYHVAQIERGLGAQVFERTARGMKLTNAGAILLRRADEILRQLEETEHEIRATESVPNGEVTVALAVTMARQLVPELLAIMDARYPLVSVKVHDVGSVPAMDLIQSGRADIALVPNAAQFSDCTATPVYVERLCLIARRAGKRHNGRPIRLADIGARPLVLASRIYDLRRRVEEAAIEAGCRLNVRYEQESQEMIRSIVIAGLAATITQAAQFDPAYERPLLDIRPIIGPEVVRTHAIVRRNDRAITKAIAVVTQTIRESVVRLVERGIFPGRIVG